MSISGLLSLLVWSTNRNRCFYNIFSFNLALDLWNNLNYSRADSCPFPCSDVNVWSYMRWTLFLLSPIVGSGLLEVMLCLTPQFLWASPSLSLFLSLLWMEVRPFTKFLCWRPAICNETYLSCAFEPVQEGLWPATGSSPVSLTERKNPPKS